MLTAQLLRSLETSGVAVPPRYELACSVDAEGGKVAKRAQGVPGVHPSFRRLQQLVSPLHPRPHTLRAF